MVMNFLFERNSIKHHRVAIKLKLWSDSGRLNLRWWRRRCENCVKRHSTVRAPTTITQHRVTECGPAPCRGGCCWRSARRRRLTRAPLAATTLPHVGSIAAAAAAEVYVYTVHAVELLQYIVGGGTVNSIMFWYRDEHTHTRNRRSFFYTRVHTQTHTW